MADGGVVRAQGANGLIEFDGTTVVVAKAKRLGIGPKPRRIALADVQRLDYEEPSGLRKGYARFAVPGQINNNVEMDKHCVLFTKKQVPEFAALRTAVKAALSTRTDAERLALRERASAGYAASRAASQEASPPEALTYGSHYVHGDVYMYPTPTGTANKTLTGARAEFESGADKSRPTLTRIGAGALLAGPAGAIVGGLFKKDTSKVYVTVVFADGDTAILEGPSKDELKLREFAAAVNRLAAG